MEAKVKDVPLVATLEEKKAETAKYKVRHVLHIASSWTFWCPYAKCLYFVLASDRGQKRQFCIMAKISTYSFFIIITFTNTILLIWLWIQFCYIMFLTKQKQWSLNDFIYLLIKLFEPHMVILNDCQPHQPVQYININLCFLSINTTLCTFILVLLFTILFIFFSFISLLFQLANTSRFCCFLSHLLAGS